MMKQWTTLLVFLFLSLSLSAQQGYGRDIFVSSKGDSLPYRMIHPESVKPGEKYPIVLFLHGAGERGNDNEKQLTHGGQMFLNPVNQEKYPIPAEMPVGQEISPILQTLKQLLDSYLVMPEVDTQRVYIIGLSMGAMGTYDLVIRYPEIFAAAIPICGIVNPSRLSAAKDVKFRIFHGDADDVVPVKGSREAYKALKAAGADVEYIEFPGCNHGSWNPAFNYPGFMDWLFKQKKKR